MPLTAMRRDEDTQDTMAVASWNLGASKGHLGPEIGSELRTEMRRGVGDTGVQRSKWRVEQEVKGQGSLRREWVGARVGGG